MSISRWKVMAGVLGVSLGGLAAIAGQCPRSDGTKTQRTDDAPLTAEAPKVPPAGAGTKPTPPSIELPAAPGGLVLPTLPTAGTDAPKLPDVPPPAPNLPTVSLPKVEATKKPDVMPPVPVTLPTPTVIPVSGTSPVSPKVQEPTVPPITGPSVPETKPLVPPTASTTVTPPSIPANPTPNNATLPAPTNNAVPPIEFIKPTTQVTPPVTVPDGGNTSIPPVPSNNPPAPMVSSPADVRIPGTQAINTAAPPVTTPTTKFRIILRVGEGEPSFEVRSGDDLVMKVACEKIDIKSPEKGQGLSAVTASGKVRFVGFGSEGTCESLSFLAGTGEVSMTGAVKIQVKDKLGRVESELTTDTIKYKLDASSLPGVLKP